MADSGIQAGNRRCAGINAVGTDLAVDGKRLQVIDGNIGGQLRDNRGSLADAAAIRLDRRGDPTVGVAQGDIAGNIPVRLLRGKCGQQRKVREIEGEIACRQELLRKLQLPVQ
ncbi:hypothetical protein D3C80_647490 [compost metagenome]